MGTRTDEYEKVKDELDDAQDELRQGRWQRRAKAAAIVIAALGTVTTAILAHFRPETIAQETAGAAAAEIRKLQTAIRDQNKSIQEAQTMCRRTGAESAAKSKAEADSVRTLVLGYLIASQGRKSSNLRASLSAVVKQLGAKHVKAVQPLLKPKKVQLTPPSRLEQLSKGAE